MRPFFEGSASYSFDDFYEESLGAGRTPSTLRISLGIASNFADVYRFVRFAKAFADRPQEEAVAAASIRVSGRARPDIP